jgi:hypothetical protein
LAKGRPAHENEISTYNATERFTAHAHLAGEWLRGQGLPQFAEIPKSASDKNYWLWALVAFGLSSSPSSQRLQKKFWVILDIAIARKMGLDLAVTAAHDPDMSNRIWDRK